MNMMVFMTNRQPKNVWFLSVIFGLYVLVAVHPAFSGVLKWRMVTSNALFSPRSSQQVFVFKDRLWTLGGPGQGPVDYANDLWSSEDGVNWRCVLEKLPFNPRKKFAFVVSPERLLVMGGVGQGDVSKEDVWMSEDGMTWVCLNGNLTTGPVHPSMGAWLNGRVYVVGCRRYDTENVDANRLGVWASRDCKIWVHVCTKVPFPEDAGSSVLISHEGSLWWFGPPRTNGTQCIWRSLDGAKWDLVTSHPGFTRRYSFGVVSHSGKLWIVGGQPDGNSCLRDVWSSTDGVNWACESYKAEFTSRANPGVASFKDAIWLIGGGWVNRNDIWVSSSGPVSTNTSGEPTPVLGPLTEQPTATATRFAETLKRSKPSGEEGGVDTFVEGSGEGPAMHQTIQEIKGNPRADELSITFSEPETKGSTESAGVVSKSSTSGKVMVRYPGTNIVSEHPVREPDQTYAWVTRYQYNVVERKEEVVRCKKYGELIEGRRELYDGRGSIENLDHCVQLPKENYEDFLKSNWLYGGLVEGLSLQEIAERYPTFQPGKLFVDGVQTRYRPNGSKELELHFNEKGEVVGNRTAYFEDGRVECSGQYDESGVKTGSWRYFFPSGKKKGVVVYDLKSGTLDIKTWYENGNPQFVGKGRCDSKGALVTSGIYRDENKGIVFEKKDRGVKGILCVGYWPNGAKAVERNDLNAENSWSVEIGLFTPDGRKILNFLTGCKSPSEEPFEKIELSECWSSPLNATKAYRPTFLGFDGPVSLMGFDFNDECYLSKALLVSTEFEKGFCSGRWSVQISDVGRATFTFKDGVLDGVVSIGHTHKVFKNGFIIEDGRDEAETQPIMPKKKAWEATEAFQ